MEVEKAYEILMNIQSDWEDGEEHESLELAIEALEKQIEGEPEWEGPTNDAKDNAEAYCPRCDYYLKDESNYCPECGQKILWK